MSGFPLSQVTGKFKAFFEKVRTSGMPSKANDDWLKKLGYTSSNDRAFLTVLKHLGFLSENNTPTQIWTDYISKKEYAVILAKAIKVAYNDFFHVYPHSENSSDDDLRAIIKAKLADADDRSVNSRIATFRSLVSLADFSSLDEFPEPADKSDKPQPTKKGSDILKIPSLNINIEIHLPNDATPQAYESIFKNIRDYLMKNE